MKITIALLVGVFFQADASQWKPAKLRLDTPWTAKVDPARPLPEYPRPTLVRERWVNLNGLWQFAPAKQGDEPPLGKDLGRSILVPFAIEAALSGIGEHHDRVFYRRIVKIPADWQAPRVRLHFGAVDWEATVWVDGQKLTTHRGGYDPFWVDLVGDLAKAGEHEIVVGVFDPTDKGPQPRGKQVKQPEGIFYTPTTGIWQTVWMEPLGALAIESVKTLTANDLRSQSAKVAVSGGGNPTVKLTARFGDKVVAQAEGPANGAPLVLAPETALLWTPETPNLYQLEVELLDEGKTVEKIQSYFALRTVGVGPDAKGHQRLLLNGKPVFHMGPLDQGYWPDGILTAPTEEALKYDIEITKKLGFNMIRKHVKVEPERWYTWCDRLGVLVWQDMPSGDAMNPPGKTDIVRTPESALIYETELARLIHSLEHHPSIVMWVVFNEGWGQFDTPRITKWTKERDPSRIVNCASGWNDHPVGDVVDAHIYPGPGVPPKQGTRARVLGEFGGLGLGLKEHSWGGANWSYQGTSSREHLTRRYVQLLREVHRLKESDGLAAAVYTQTTDVETEINGLLAYDRRLIKVDLETVAKANQGTFEGIPEPVTLLKDGRSGPQDWRYTTQSPAEGWMKKDFDDSSWSKGKSGFGSKGTPGARIGTEWTNNEIWLRREFPLPADLGGTWILTCHHDEDVEIYINGVLAAKATGFTSDYEELEVSPEAAKTLKLHGNVLAVKCKQTRGGQYIDVGLIVVPKGSIAGPGELQIPPRP